MRAQFIGGSLCVEAARRLAREGTGDGARGVLRGLRVIMQPQQTRKQLCVSVCVRFVTLTLASIQQQYSTNSSQP